MDRYEVLCSMGYEPIGETYLQGPTAVEICMDGLELVVCKMPHDIDGEEAKEEARVVIEREATILERLKPYRPELPIPGIKGYDERSSVLITEHFPGPTYDTILRRCSTLPEIVEAIRKCSGALGKLHDTGHLHGDVHFNNGIDFDGGSLIDFASCGTEEEYQRGEACEHSSPFSPPEFYDAVHLRMSADVFSLGLNSFAQVLGWNPQDLEDEILDYGFSRVFSSLRREISTGGRLNNDLGHLFSGMLVMDPKDRITMWEVYDAAWCLQGIIAD